MMASPLTTLEKNSSTDTKVDVEVASVTQVQRLRQALLRWGLETHGITPTAAEDRVDKRLYQMFFVWFSSNFNILVFGTGSAGPAFFSLGLRDSFVILLVVDIVASAIPAYFAVFGPKLGTRGMVQCRFSWGYYGSLIPSVLNVFSMQGFLILNSIIGGQCLAAVSDRLNATLGIVIISVVSLVVTFCGYKVVHVFESVAWIPNAIAIPILLGLGGKHLKPSDIPQFPPATVSRVLSFASFLASSVISWCTMIPDYGVYHDEKASSLKIFTYVYFGFFLSTVPWQMLGVTFAAAAGGVSSWEAGFEGGANLGGLLAAVLAPAGGFGKFLLVLLALATCSACAPSMYSFGISFMTISPVFARVPRYVFAIISAAILIPVAIVGATRFYSTLVNILSVIGYWSTAFAGIVLAEHIIFRKNEFSTYIVDDWNNPRKLPPGIAAIASFFCAFGIIVPSMSQTWYTGPIAKAGTGDIGVFTGFVVASLCYGGFRFLERRIFQKNSS